MKRTKSELTKSNKRGSFKSATSKIKDWEPKVSPGPFRDTKTNKGVQFPQCRKPYP
jgi:hypothetical protein